MATLSKETLIPLGLVGAVVFTVCSATMWVMTLIFGSKFEPRFISLEAGQKQILDELHKKVDSRDFELWIERSRNLDPAHKLADPPR